MSPCRSGLRSRTLFRGDVWPVPATSPVLLLQPVCLRAPGVDRARPEDILLRSPKTQLARCPRRDIEAVIPHPGRADKVRILAERGQNQLCLVVRNETATGGNDLAYLIQKEIGAFHDAAAEHNHVRHE